MLVPVVEEVELGGGEVVVVLVPVGGGSVSRRLDSGGASARNRCSGAVGRGESKWCRCSAVRLCMVGGGAAARTDIFIQVWGFKHSC